MNATNPTKAAEQRAYAKGYSAGKKAAQKGAHAIYFTRDVSMETAEKRTTGEYNTPLNDRTWHKRASLVFTAVLLSDAPEPCPGVGRPAPVPGGATTAVTAATHVPPGVPRSPGR